METTSKQVKFKNNRYKFAFIIISSLLVCSAIASLDLVFHLSYVPKSAIKILLFTLPVLLYKLIFKNSYITHQLKNPNKRNLKVSALIAAGVSLVIIGAYLIFKDYISAENIRDNLAKRENIDASNFLYVALHIAFVNSLLEEIFFRAFIFYYLNKLNLRIFAYIYSSLLFSLYHVTTIAAWFDWWLNLIIIVALFVVGIIFDYFCEKSNSFLAPWFLHIVANLSINGIAWFSIL